MDKFITFGTKNINASIFRDIVPFNTKPYGGLWLTKYTDINANEWLMFLEEHPSIFYYKFNGEASIVTLNDNANILYINNIEDFNNAYNKYPSDNENRKILNYPQITKDYDGLYINSKIIYEIGYEDYCISSLILFNPFAIKSYKPIDVAYYKDSYSIEYEVTKEYEEKQINYSTNEKFIKLYNLIRENFFSFLDLSKIDLNTEKGCNLLFNIVDKFVDNFLIFYENEINSILNDKDFEFISKNTLINGISHKLYSEIFKLYKGIERK